MNLFILSVQRELKKKQLTPLGQIFKMSRKSLQLNIIGQTWPFLVLYVFFHNLVQVGYQSDWFCSEENGLTLNMTAHERCIKRVQRYFAHWDSNEATMTQILTFLLGFYVSTIARRWWEQVRINRF